MPTEIVTRPAPDGAIRVNLTMPVTRIGFGMFSVDPLQEIIGAPLSEILSSLMVRPVFRRPSEAGPAVEVYALALPDGEGAAVPLGQWGEVGFRNARSLLVLTVPLPMAGWVRQKVGSAIEKGPIETLSLDGTARVAEFWIRLHPGMRAAFPLGMFGECGVEAG